MNMQQRIAEWIEMRTPIWDFFQSLIMLSWNDNTSSVVVGMRFEIRTGYYCYLGANGAIVSPWHRSNFVHKCNVISRFGSSARFEFFYVGFQLTIYSIVGFNPISQSSHKGFLKNRIFQQQRLSSYTLKLISGFCCIIMNLPLRY
jgi:hypothetical protein